MNYCHEPPLDKALMSLPGQPVMQHDEHNRIIGKKRPTSNLGPSRTSSESDGCEVGTRIAPDEQPDWRKGWSDNERAWKKGGRAASKLDPKPSPKTCPSPTTPGSKTNENRSTVGWKARYLCLPAAKSLVDRNEIKPAILRSEPRPA